MTDCCCIYVDEPATLVREEIRRAKVEHRCCECAEVIPRGAKYERAAVLYDGSWGSYATCLPCLHIRDDLFSCGFYYGQMRDSILGCLGFDYLADPSTYEDDEEE